MTLRTPVVFTASATTTSRWYKLDYRYDQNSERAFVITLASTTESMAIQVAASAEDSPEIIVTTSTFTGDTQFSGVLNGSWPMIRFIKTGSVGDGTVIFVG